MNTSSLLLAREKFVSAKRSTPTWPTINTTAVTNAEIARSVMAGKLPIGTLPLEFISEAERVEIVNKLKTLKQRKYDNTTDQERVYVHGNPFVDYASVSEYLSEEPDTEFEQLTEPLLDRVRGFFHSLGYKTQPLVDGLTGLPYKAKVVREISVPEGCYQENSNGCTVSHCDDILRDGFLKPDFRLPNGIEPGNYEQFSVCVQLENGGYRPDHLEVMETKFSPEMLPEFNGWRAPSRISDEARKCIHVPQLRQAYMFSTLMIHDVRGGHPQAKRLNFSVFFVAVGKNLYFYN